MCPLLRGLYYTRWEPWTQREREGENDETFQMGRGHFFAFRPVSLLYRRLVPSGERRRGAAAGRGTGLPPPGGSRPPSGGEPLRVETQRRLEASSVSLPAPTVGTGVEKVNINKADAAALQSLPGIGEKRAKDIVADREANGPYRFPEELTRVKGIGEETVAGLLEYIVTEDEP